MYNISESPSREEVLTFLSKSASYGNLGAFIGAGFSKAVLNDTGSEIALSWGELLNRASSEMGIDYDKIWKEGVGYPEVASEICKLHALANGNDHEKSLNELKRMIANLTSWYPDKDKREKFSKYLESLSPAWVITTNYDLIIESLLTGKSIPLGPNDSLSSQNGVIPVFHLHGIRTNPEEIIIAQEDYVALFRPSEYRQIKLALTIKESTTLLLGYGVGDVNVLTALDWSRNVFKGNQANYPNDVVQVLRKTNPNEAPYRDKNGIVIIEVEDLSEFFQQYLEVRSRVIAEEKLERENLTELAQRLDAADVKMIDQFIDDQAFRADMLNTLGKSSIYLISGFVFFLNKCIDTTWARTNVWGAFHEYNNYLKIILDILTSFSMAQFPPALFQTAAYGLYRTAYYVGDGPGQSWVANKTWQARKKELSPEVIREIRNFAAQHDYQPLEHLVLGL
ncbi:SIR2 family NAD-dependent protein deacylase [Noviherbaspirillum soli]|uniref:SIR2 family NAD-dependent protein deacylase n=1 Tax=Noviherbaspirillum soli TaxID=1064518 RepID=UPI00188CE037|nr:SIR2 family protein [Noviherbaspirillum soli]